MATKWAMVFSGGGARGAYEAGVLHYVRTALPPELRRRRFDIVSGTSVGAINAAFVAGTADRPEMQGERARELWEAVDENRIYKRDWREVGKFLLRTGTTLTGNFVRFNPGKHRNPLTRHFVSLFDSSPFPEYIASILPFADIGRNIEAGHLSALSVAATNLTSNTIELFIQKHADVAYEGNYIWHDTPVTPKIVMASSAIPFAFPAVRIGRHWYSDGGIHLNTPISPAIQLGANRILVVGMHTHAQPAPHHHSLEHPPTGKVAAAVIDALFEDRVGFDLEQLSRINRIIDWANAVYGDDFVARINQYLKTSGERGDIAGRGLRRVDLMAICPSRDLADVFEEQLAENPYLDKCFSTFERFAMRMWSIDPREGKDVLSYLLFSKKYIRALLDLGYRDARARHDELVRFFSGEPMPNMLAHMHAA